MGVSNYEFVMNGIFIIDIFRWVKSDRPYAFRQASIFKVSICKSGTHLIIFKIDN